MKKNVFNKKGFTLIELLVGLIVIGLIAGLLIGIFGSPVQMASIQKASTQIQDQLRSVQDGASYYTTQKTTEITVLNDLTDATKLNPTPLSIVPAAPAQAKDAAFVGTYAYTFVDADATYKIWGAAGTNDTVVTLPGITAEVCLRMDQDQGMLTSAQGVADIPAAVQSNYKIFCWNNAGTYTVVALLYPH